MTVKLCIDCIHFMPGMHLSSVKSYAFEFGTCGRKKKFSLVTGHTKIEDLGYCSVERMSYDNLDTCGVDGKYFEPNPIPPEERDYPWNPVRNKVRKYVESIFKSAMSLVRQGYKSLNVTWR